MMALPGSPLLFFCLFVFLFRASSMTIKRTRSRLTSRNTLVQTLPNQKAPKLRSAPVGGTNVDFIWCRGVELKWLMQAFALSQVCLVCWWSAVLSGRICCTHHCDYSTGAGTCYPYNIFLSLEDLNTRYSSVGAYTHFLMLPVFFFYFNFIFFSEDFPRVSYSKVQEGMFSQSTGCSFNQKPRLL